MPDLLAAVVQLGSASRLYELTIKGAAANDQEQTGSDLLVEAFACHEALHEISERHLIALSTSAHLPLESFIGARADLAVSLSDGSRTSFSGLINQAAQVGSEGGLARYRFTIVPWLWLLTQRRTSRVFQDKSIVDIVDAIFQDYAPHAAWNWSSDAQVFLKDVPPRSFCCQYRESDFDFLQRLLAEEGLSYRIEDSDKAPSGHQLVLLADTTQTSACPEDPTSLHALGGHGIRFHGGRAGEEQDSIQALSAQRTLQAAAVTLLSYDYKAKKAVAASVPTHHAFGGKNAPRLEAYDTPGVYAYTDSALANRYGQLHMQAREARNKLWQGSSTVRTLRPGTQFTLTQGPLNADDNATPSYTVLSVTSVGINNMPKEVSESLAELFGPIPQLLEDCLADVTVRHANDESTSAGSALQPARAIIAKAEQLGYANQFDALRSDIPWRPVLEDGTGLRHHPRPTALGSQSAIVVGADGQTTAGADEVYCDRLGRIRIQFHWQGQHDDAGANCWVRVAQRAAGGGMGVQFLPRIGQEVLVKFLEGDIDRPLVVGALYNGQGEGGILPTSGGQSDQNANVIVFDGATDHLTSAQGNLAGGNSPVWHGASADASGHNNSSAQWGIRSKEWGGWGYNQLVFDDTDQQGRIQLKTTQAATELGLGHLIHTADNYRGSFRGTGAELRTDAYGAVRAGQGLLITSYGIAHSARQRDPAGDNSAGIALLKQATQLAQSFHTAAVTHQTVGLAMHTGAEQANRSHIHDAAAPMQALYTAAAGMVSQDTLEQAQADAARHTTSTGDDKLPHTSDPIIAIAAKAGLAAVAGQELHLANGETTGIASGGDTQFASGGQARLHTGQAIGMLAGAVKAGAGQTGLQLIAAQGAIDVQAQSGTLKVQAKDKIDVISANAHIDWAAAKKISLSTAGGANITIEGGNITVQCPGKITVHASEKKFDGPARMSYALPQFPKYVPKLKRQRPVSS